MLDDILSYLGDALDKPGRATRGLLGGHPEELAALIPFSDSMGMTDPANRVSGTDLAQKLFGLSPDDFGGKAAGFGLEMALDPTNLIGLGAAGKAVKGVRAAEAGIKGEQAAAHAANAARDALLAKGYMPQEVANLTRAGAPDVFLHTPNVEAGGHGIPWRTHSMEELQHDQRHLARASDISDAQRRVDAMRMFPSGEAGETALTHANNAVDNYEAGIGGDLGRMASLDSFMGHDVPLYDDTRQAIDQYMSKGEYPHDLMRAIRDDVYETVDDARRGRQLGGFSGYPQMSTQRSFLDVRNPLDVTGIGHFDATPEQNAFQEWLIENRGNRPWTGSREYWPELAKWLQENGGYDSLMRTTETSRQYAVPSASQSFHPWLAPAEVPVPADYSGPFAIRAGAMPIGANAAYAGTRTLLGNHDVR